MPYATFNRTAANDPDYWRLRAEEAQTVAETFVNPQAREQMQRIVDAYERLAEIAAKAPILPMRSEGQAR
jgi:hypothetical protein